MIFSSDLDRTLIYSEKFTTNHDGIVKTVESGKYLSFMTQKAAEMLMQISGMLTFIPCTTRTIEQYQRIDFFNSELIPSYAVVTNGGNIIIDGRVDEDYNKGIKKDLATNCLSQEDVLREFQRISKGDWAEPMRCADELFLYCIIERDRLPTDEIIDFTAWLKLQNWEISIQGRKLYLVPKMINKRDALIRICELSGKKLIFAAGDSLLDLPMLAAAKYAICPKHGELHEHYANAEYPWKLTQASGISAAEEILADVIASLNSHGL